jgi:hypothetical protein
MQTVALLLLTTTVTCACAAEYLFPVDPAFDLAAMNTTVNAELKARTPDLGWYKAPLRINALSRINRHTYKAYGIAPLAGRTIQEGSVDAEILDVALVQDTADLRRISASLPGGITDMGTWGVFVHFVYTVKYTWNETDGAAVVARDTRSEIETHHILYPQSSVLAAAQHFGLGDQDGIILNGDYFPLN